MTAAFYILGPLLIAAAILDAIWTAFWVDGGAGPITARLTKWIWRGWLRLVGTHRHRTLSLAGPGILVSTALVWILLLWAGWTLLFSADPDSLVNATDQTQPNLAGRVWYVGYTLFTVGNGDFNPHGDRWQLLSGLAAASGLGLATLAITYLLNVLSAVVQKRSFAGHVTGIGNSPENFVCNAWTGEGFHAIDVQLNSLVKQLGTLTHQHLAYPVLHYYHAAQSSYASAVAVAILDEALTLIECGLKAPAQPNQAILRSARQSVQSYLQTLAKAFIEPADHAPQPPDLARIRDAGLPVVQQAHFQQAVKSLDDRRKRLLAMMVKDAWQWPPA